MDKEIIAQHVLSIMNDTATRLMLAEKRLHDNIALPIERVCAEKLYYEAVANYAAAGVAVIEAHLACVAISSAELQRSDEFNN